MLAFVKPFLFLSGKKFTVSVNFLLLVLKCLKFYCFMLQSLKIKCLVLWRYPHSDPPRGHGTHCQQQGEVMDFLVPSGHCSRHSDFGGVPLEVFQCMSIFQQQIVVVVAYRPLHVLVET